MVEQTRLDTPFSMASYTLHAHEQVEKEDSTYLPKIEDQEV